MDFQALCEIAERELNAGIPNEALVRRAFVEANGVQAAARQIYWHLRATQLREHGDHAVRESVLALEQRERRIRSRKETNRWFWAAMCVIGMVGAFIFPLFAFRAMGKDGRAFLIYFVLSAGSLALAVVSYLASRYHTHVE